MNAIRNLLACATSALTLGAGATTLHFAGDSTLDDLKRRNFEFTRLFR